MRVHLAIVILFVCSTKCLRSIQSDHSVTDKNNSPYSLNSPAAYLSQKSNRQKNKTTILQLTAATAGEPNLYRTGSCKQVMLLIKPGKMLNQILNLLQEQ
jgi:hypothetical protein